MERELTLELVRITEAAALRAARWMGRGDNEGADQAAVDAMRALFDTVELDGVVVIGEGEKDRAPMLYIGERVGSAVPGAPEVDVAVDPVEGTNLVATGRPGALAVVAVAPRGGLLHAPDIYMEKLAVGGEAAGTVSLDAPVAENLAAVARARKKRLRDVAVVMLERERNRHYIEEVRALGARIHLISDGDVSAAIATAVEDTGVDILLGIGGAPEGVLSACALRCLGGEIQGRLWPRTEAERRRARQMGVTPPRRILHMDDLVSGDDVIFAATGITGGAMLEGVKFRADGAYTDSIAMRARTGTVRFVKARHQLEQKPILKDMEEPH